MLRAIALIAAAGGLAHAEPVVSIYDAPPLAGARYISRIVPTYDTAKPYRAVVERGAFHCLPLVSAMHGRFPEPAELAAGQKTCDLAVGVGIHLGLRNGSDVVTVIDAKGTRFTDFELIRAMKPIDKPAKALVAVWLSHPHDMQWYDGAGVLRGGEAEGRVRAVGAGWEVEISETSFAGCMKQASQSGTTTRSRVILAVDAEGEVTEARKVPVATEARTCR